MKYEVLKRFADVLLAIALIIALVPIYTFVGLIITLQDRGSVFFEQYRVGENGKEFLFFKFRSMPMASPNVESHERGKLKITPFGKFIRRTNLDELPQFYNVLKGDMSFIGPRPPIPSQVGLVKLRKDNGSLFLKPGLTGLAQVNSYDGMPEEEKATYDGEYFQNFSFRQDVIILFKTVKYFTKKPPTY
jgi:O-antigen biosynthesis protein WbqP